MFKSINKRIVFSAISLISLASCKQIYDVPNERDYMSPRADFTRKVLGAENDFVLGRTTMTQSTEFNSDNSSFPMNFEIVNVRFGDGTPTEDILQKKKVLVWTQPYTGFEQSLAEIDAKRKEEDRPIFEVRPSGQFVLWSSSRAADFAKANGDTAVIDSEYTAPQERRYFDVRLSNWGERIIRDFQLNFYRERPYEPSKDLEPFTGKPTGTYNHPSVSSIYGANTKRDVTSEGVDVYMRRVGDGRSLTFRFWKADSTPINPNKFKDTKWDELVHGFNMVKDSVKVKYDVAYPIPLAKLPTLYTGGRNSNGDEARVQFRYSRIIGKLRRLSSLGYNFRIFEEGDWEIIFYFKTE